MTKLDKQVQEFVYDETKNDPSPDQSKSYEDPSLDKVLHNVILDLNTKSKNSAWHYIKYRII